MIYKGCDKYKRREIAINMILSRSFSDWWESHMAKFYAINSWGHSKPCTYRWVYAKIRNPIANALELLNLSCTNPSIFNGIYFTHIVSVSSNSMRYHIFICCSNISIIAYLYFLNIYAMCIWYSSPCVPPNIIWIIHKHQATKLWKTSVNAKYTATM